MILSLSNYGNNCYKSHEYMPKETMSDLLLNRRAVIKTAAIATTGSLLSSRLWAQDTTSAARPRAGAGAAGGPVSSLLKPIVETTVGKVRGYSLNGADIFKGIPFAASTGGARRFLSPVKPQPWPGVRSCLSYGHACPQLSGGIPAGDNQTHGDEDSFLLYRSFGPQGMGEDCLRLNVWTPAANTNRTAIRGSRYLNSNAVRSSISPSIPSACA